MIEKLQPLLKQWTTLTCFIGLFLFVGNYSVQAQTTSDGNGEPVKPLQAGVSMLEFSGNINWHTYYLTCVNCGSKERSQTRVRLALRNIYMLNSHVGLGYKGFANFYISGFFKGWGIGAGGLGPVARYYPFKSARWQPYLQGGFLAGINTALASLSGANTGEGIRFRSGLRAGLGYKVSNTFGLFLELGPVWEYNTSFQLEAHALQIDVGIILFRF